MMPPNSNTLTQKQTKRMARRKRTECGGEGDNDPQKTAVQNQNIIQNFRSPDEQGFLLQTSRHCRAKSSSTAFSSSLFFIGIHRRTTHLTTSKQDSSNLPFPFHHRRYCHHWHHLVLLILALIFYCPQLSSAGSASSSPALPSNDHPPLHHHHYHHHHHQQQQHQLPRPSLEHQQEQFTTTTTTSTAKWSNSSIAAAAAAGTSSDLVRNSSSLPSDAHLLSLAPALAAVSASHQRGGGSHYRETGTRTRTEPQNQQQQQRHKRNLLHQGSSAAPSTKYYLLNSNNHDGPQFSAHYQPPPESTYQQQQQPPGPLPPMLPPPMYGNGHPMMAALPPLTILPIDNETASVGRNAVLKCVISRPGQYKVAWLKMDERNELTLLTLGLHPLVTEDEGKYRVTHNERQWLLHISRVTVADRGRYMCQINAKTMTSQTGYLDVYEPPVINEELTSSDTTVDELQKVSLRCATSGYPAPSVSWRRESGKALNLGLYGGKKHAAKTLDGEYLNISQVTREDMGPYLCIASNGVPPSVSKRIVLQVNFRPKIRVHSQLVSAYLGSDVELECRVEASPRPETVWLTGTGQRLEELLETTAAETTAVGGNSSNFEGQLSNTDKSTGHLGANNRQTGSSSNLLLLPSSKRKKYQFDEESDGYRTVMRLTLRRLESVDFGSYKCVAKNGLGEKEGLVRLYEIPVPTLPPTTTTSTTSTAPPPPPPPRTQKSVSGGSKDKTPWMTSGDGQDAGQQYGPHSSNFGSRSLRENQQQQQNGKGVKSGGNGDFGVDEEEEADLDESEDYQLAKYLTEQYQTKKRRKKTNSGEGQRNCGADSIRFGGSGGGLWWLSFEVLTAIALAFRTII